MITYNMCALRVRDARVFKKKSYKKYALHMIKHIVTIVKIILSCIAFDIKTKQKQCIWKWNTANKIIMRDEILHSLFDSQSTKFTVSILFHK